MTSTKLRLFLNFLVVFGIAETSYSGAHAIQSPRRSVSRAAMNDTIESLRGGDLGSINGKALAKAFSVLAGTDAMCGSLVPITSMKWFGIIVTKDSLSSKYLHGIGASAATISLATFLAVTGRLSVEKAIGCGFAARLISMTLMILTNEESKVGMNFSMFWSLWLVISATIYSLFTGTGDPLTTSKVVSVILGIHGLFLYLKPHVFLRKTAIAVGPDHLVKDILSIDGGYMFASAITTGLLAQGVDPVKVAGYTALGFVPVLYKFFEVIETERMWGVSSSLVAIGVVTAMACIIVGTLH